MSELTCRVLPGAHAREYTCHAHVPWMSHLDVVYAAIACLLYVGVMPRPFLYWPGAICIWLWLKSRIVIQESILAMKDVGIQVRTVYWGGRTVSRFIDRRKIHDIVINEGITMWQIKSYMAIIVKNQEHMIVVFEHLLPRLRPTLLEAYAGTRAIIFPHAFDD
ncbi:hypothetical protein LRAMOSA06991 [Lichtheimia ramosa]|uniref:Phosphatidylinositol N-acetylglucosaminyltransferase subunit H conserved domain-containing protein n=1 Tax=Lichtheimia ramosa TaxID=688394 RepID=A0A077WAJ0_9FUNG|nr:hypothetical protein LRAMOSA06991 [Lichtheimia ramosa]